MNITYNRDRRAQNVSTSPKEREIDAAKQEGYNYLSNSYQDKSPKGQNNCTVQSLNQNSSNFDLLE